MEEREKIAHRVLYTDFVSNSPDIVRERKGGKKKRKKESTLSPSSRSLSLFSNRSNALKFPNRMMKLDERKRTKAGYFERDE